MDLERLVVVQHSSMKDRLLNGDHLATRASHGSGDRRTRHLLACSNVKGCHGWPEPLTILDPG